MRWLIVLLAIHLGADISQVTFVLAPDPIDVVIPCAPKDAEVLERCINGIRKYGQNIRRIIIISQTPLISSAEWFDESKFPFSKKDIALEMFRGDELEALNFLAAPKSRIGWIYQQFLKLYAPFVIPNISSNVLILDADVIFLNPISFMTDTGEPLFATGKEYWKPYFDLAERLLPGLHRVHENSSGIVHHMLFQKPILEDLFQLISMEHGTEPWKAICHCIDLKEIHFAALSEYEIYFNFSLLRTPQAHIRPLKWTNISHLHDRKKHQKKGYAYVAYHDWRRKK